MVVLCAVCCLFVWWYRAQAIAKESGATFINVRMGAVTQKYVGEGEKIVAAIFRYHAVIV